MRHSISAGEIEESIRYASRIQKAMLPSEADFKRNLPHSFILYQSLDVVSGDFYWISRKKNRIAVAAVDCTGHGVPGAFMSIMGISFLNQITQGCIPVTNKILNHLREYVMKALKQKGNEMEQKDGMDMSVCVIDLEKQWIEYSGANNYLFYFNQNELISVKPDRMPIGISPVPEESFAKHIIPFEQIDSFYLFTDGFADQLGGIEDKKLKLKGFRNFISKASALPMQEQGEYLLKEFNLWKAHGEQIDDILVLGVDIKSFKNVNKHCL